MSKESIDKFILDASENSKLGKILEKARKRFDSSEERFEYVVQEAKKHGYDFTVSDMVSAMGERNNSLLDDDDLLNVSGGMVVDKNFDLNNNRSKKFWKRLL